MSDDAPRAELRELATKLFAAARAERPGPALGRRLLLIQPRNADATGSPPMAESSGARQRAPVRARASWATGVAAVALVAGGVGFLFASQREAEVRISPERAGERRAVAVATAAPEGAPVGPGPSLAAAVAPAASPARPVDERPGAALEPPAPGRASGSGGPSRQERAPLRVGESHRSGKAVAPERASPSDTAASGAAQPASAALSEASTAAPASAPTPAPTPTPAPAATTPTAPAEAARPLALRDELALLKDARAALRSGDARHALELLDRHASTATGSPTARSPLLAEATVLRIETLAALGRREDASELAARFVRDDPHSALGDRAKSFIQSAPPAAP